jgi:HEAT repeat protein
VIRSFVDAERRSILAHIRFRSRRLEAAFGDQQAINLPDLSVPLRILYKKTKDGATDSAKQSSPIPTHVPRISASARVDTADESQTLQFDVAFAALPADKKPLVILGDPGSGKSWLIALRTWQMLDDLERNELSSPHAVLPLRVTCRELGEQLAASPEPDSPHSSLAYAVTQIVVRRLRDHDFDSSVACGADALIKECFQEDRVVLLIDGWDETDPLHQDRVAQALTARIGTSKQRLILTSRPMHYARGLLPCAIEWQLVPFGLAEAKLFIERWFGPSDKQGRQLLQGLDEPHSLQIMQVPLLVSILCWLREHDTLSALPTHRAALLLETLQAILRDACRPAQDDQARVLSSAPDDIAQALLHVLSKLAYETYTGERWSHSETKLLDALASSKYTADLGGPLALKLALTGRFGLFTITFNQELEIIHQSFAEVLCANWVAETFRKRRDDFNAWLETHGGIRFLDPRWHQVWRHIATLIDDALPLFEELWRHHEGGVALPPRRCRRREKVARKAAQRQPHFFEDILDTTLSLAGHCLAVRREYVDSNIGQAIVAKLTSRALKRATNGDDMRCRALVALGRVGVIGPILDILKATGGKLENIGGQMAVLLGEPLAGELLCCRTHEADDLARGHILQILASLNCASEEVLCIVKQDLNCPDRNQRIRATIALDILVGHDPIAVPLLLSLFDDADDVIRFQARNTFGRLRAYRDSIDLSDVVARYARSRNAKEKIDVLTALSLVGKSDASIIEVLKEALSDPDTAAHAAFAVRDIKPVIRASDLMRFLPTVDDALVTKDSPPFSVSPEDGAMAVSLLLDCLTHEEECMRARAAFAMGCIRSAEARGVLALRACLSDSSPLVRTNASWALLALDSKTTEPIGILLEIVAQNGIEMRRALNALCGGGARAVDGFSTALVSVDSAVRETALRCLSSLAEDGVDVSPALPGLIAAVSDKEACSRRQTAQILARLGQTAARAVPRLLDLTRDGDAWCRFWAAEALGEIRMQSVEVVAQLRRLLHDTERRVRWAAAEALGKLSPAALVAVPELLSLQEDSHDRVRIGVMQALAQLAVENRIAIRADGFLFEYRSDSLAIADNV